MEASQQGALKDNEVSLTESGHSDKKIGLLLMREKEGGRERERTVTNISNKTRILPVEVAG